MPVYQLPDKGTDVAARSDPFVREARQNVSAPNASEMDDDLSVIAPTKGEPGIPLVRDTALGVDLEACLNQRGFNPVELRQFTRGPIPAAPEYPLQIDDIRAPLGQSRAQIDGAVVRSQASNSIPYVTGS